MKKELLVSLGVAFLAGPIAAHSAPITYDFLVNGGSSGPLAGQTATGSFSVDSSNTPASGGVLNATGLLSDLSFTWDGISYNALTANTGSLIISRGSSGPVFVRRLEQIATLEPAVSPPAVLIRRPNPPRT